MTAIEVVTSIMEEQEITLSELAEYAGVGSRSNVHHLLNLRKDLKVSTFVKLLEALGYQLVAQGENGDDIIVDYD